MLQLPRPPSLTAVLQVLHEIKILVAANRQASHDAPWIDAHYTEAWINPVTHRLQTLTPRRPLHDEVDDICEAIRLATILYTYALRGLPDTKSTPVTHQATKLVLLLQSPRTRWSQLPLLKLWTLAVLTFSVLDEPNSRWLAATLRTAAHALHIRSTADLVNALRHLAWEREFSPAVLERAWMGSGVGVGVDTYAGAFRQPYAVPYEYGSAPL